MALSPRADQDSTNDPHDVLLRRCLTQVCGIVDDLTPDFIGDGDAAALAADTGARFNLVHVETLLTVDIFAAHGDFNAAALKRAIALSLGDGVSAVRFASVEDVLVAKLRWSALGGREPAVQRRDIEGLIRLNRERIDWEYVGQAVQAQRLEGVAREFGVGGR